MTRDTWTTPMRKRPGWTARPDDPPLEFRRVHGPSWASDLRPELGTRQLDGGGGVGSRVRADTWRAEKVK